MKKVRRAQSTSHFFLKDSIKIVAGCLTPTLATLVIQPGINQIKDTGSNEQVLFRGGRFAHASGQKATITSGREHLASNRK